MSSRIDKAEKSRTNRRRYLQQQLAKAATPAAELWAACNGLVAEARRAGRVHDATRAVLDLIEELRKQEVA
jgi:hypothetical protein